MSDFMCEDLIDLTIEDTASSSIPSTAAAAAAAAADLFSPLLRGRESLDNNPFDSLQKLANRPDDPFETMEKEACLKARNLQHIQVDVKTGNLLSLSADDLDSDDNQSLPAKSANVPQFGSDATMCSVGSTIYHTTVNNTLEAESPPESLLRNTETGSASSTDDGGSAKTKKTSMEQRKRLLKLSISNSTFNSPLCRRPPIQQPGFTESEDKCSPISAILMEAANFGEHLLASESPLKFVDDDLMSDCSPGRAAERDFDADIEMLKIPMLKELPSPVVEEAHALCAKPNSNILAASKMGNTSTLSALPDLNALRARLRTKREEQGQQDITTLIGNLKTLLCKTDIVDDQRKQQANSLLETLTAALTSALRTDANSVISDELQSSITPPQTIVRQGTFDIDLQKNEKTSPKEDLMTQSTQSVRSNPPVEEMPDVMFKSSATYDGDPSEDQGDLKLPVVESPTSPLEMPPISHVQQGSQQQQQQQHHQLDVNDIIEQLTKLLEQHQPHSDSSDGSVGQNPTFIVVMNSSAAHKNVDNSMDCSFSHGPSASELHNSIRRRSQSLSIHDKLKIVQLPLHRVPNSSASASDAEMDTPPVSTPPMHTNALEFKTPSRPALRRNSFSSGTPYTPMIPRFGYAETSSRLRRSEAGSQMRRSTLAEEEHLQAIVHPMQNLPSLNSFKPDLKKKSYSNKESIMKSSGPLKATIPVKKVAPMVKITSPPDHRANGSNAAGSRGGGLNNSMQLLTKSSRMSLTSTPMPLTRSGSSGANGAANFPSACSTPSLSSSFFSRTKPRYLYSAASPNPKPPTTLLTTASGARRRTLTELKIKSPSRPRLSNIGPSTSKPTTTSSATRSSLTPSARTGIKQPSQSNYARPSNRINKRVSSTTSGESSLASNKNKENKHS